MAEDRSKEDREATARLAAAYLDMWESTVTAHALKGPPGTPLDQASPSNREDAKGG